MDAEGIWPIASDRDVVLARQKVRDLAREIGFSSSEMALIATAISELARNILQYAGRGEIMLDVLHEGARVGISIIAQDQGPGIPDISLAMQDGYSTGGGMGLGLPGTKRLMDEFSLASESGKGTTVIAKKWLSHG